MTQSKIKYNIVRQIEVHDDYTVFYTQFSRRELCLILHSTHHLNRKASEVYISPAGGHGATYIHEFVHRAHHQLIKIRQLTTS